MAFLQTTAASISSGGTINGDLTIEGDLTVNGDGAGTYNEIINGNLRLDTPGSAATTLEFVPTGGQASQIKFFQDDGSTQDARIFSPEGAEDLAFEAGTTEIMRLTPNQVSITSSTSDRPILNVENTNADNAPSAIHLYKNSSSPANSDQIGDISWYAKDDGANKVRLLLLRGFQTDIAASSDDSKLSMYTTSNGSEVETLTLSSGTVFIGGTQTSSEGTNQRLKFHGSGDNYILTGCYEDNGWGYFNSYNNANGIQFYTGAGAFYFNNGNVGIGVSDADSDLEIKGTGTTSQQYIRLRNSDDTQQMEFASDGSGVPFIGISNSAGSTKVSLSSGGSYFATGNVGIGTSSPGSAAGANALDIRDTNSQSATQGASLRLGSNDGSVMGAGYRMGVIEFAGPEDGGGTMVGGARIDALAVDAFTATGTYDHNSKLRFSVQSGISGTDQLAVPAMILDANSKISLSNNDNDNTGNTILGASAFNCSSNNGSDYNVVIGQTAMGTGTVSAASHNVAIGADVIADSTSATGNVAIGSSAMYNATQAGSCVAIGRQAMGLGVVTQTESVAIGLESMKDATGGSGGNTAIGTQSLFNLTDGSNNVAIGKVALNGAGVNPSNAVAIGYAAGRYAEGNNNVALGHSALKGDNGGNFDGHSNIAIGFEAMDALEDGEEYNIAIGSGAMGAAAEGSGTIDLNIAIGTDALKSADYTTNARQFTKNIAIGHYALDATSNGEMIGAVAIGHNALTASQAVIGTALGYLALEDMTSGVGNTALGYRACEQITDSGYNTVVGHQALNAEIQGSHNVALGYQALYSQNKGSSAVMANIGIGVEAGYHNDTGSNNVWLGYKCGTGVDGNSNNNNVGIGFEAAKGITTANGSVCIGYQAGTLITSGIHNICIGYQAGNTITEGQGNVLIGTGAVPSHAVNIDDSIVISAGTDALQGGVTESIRIGVDSDYIENVFGTNASWAHSSDERIKKDIKDNTLGLDFINDLRTVTFKKKAPSEYPKEFNTHNETKTKRKNPDKVSYGFIAQEVKEAMDKAGHSDFTAWSEGGDTMQMLAESELITPLVKAIQELTARVKELESN
tara:strand:+ start:398 stop:3640 length:3243 start_codon:yes stop_codon:yes gene_type:complete